MRVLDPKAIVKQMRDARQRTLALIEGLDAKQMMGPKLATINPLLWEIAHATYFYEYWILRQHLGQKPIRADVDKLFDSINIAHDDRWDLPLPVLQDTKHYMKEVLLAVERAMLSGNDEQRDYLAQYAVYHEDMHTEAFTYTRQTLAYPAPPLAHKTIENFSSSSPQLSSKDVWVPAGTFKLGAKIEDGFAFDNEKWAHDREVAAFSISATAVSNAEYLAFVEAEGYSEAAYWCEEGLLWREQRALSCPVYWRKTDVWQLRQFDQWIDLPLEVAVIHVSWYEASAYCRWAKRRLPTELEWELAASAVLDDSGQLSGQKNYFPWGNEEPRPEHANLNGLALGTVDVNAHAAGDSALGCRQMLGNVWEWTESDFLPYPDFTPDMYADYSQPLFGTTKVLRGGAWTTRGRMIRNTWRTYYGADRNDVFSGFRTCALSVL